jgi:hypothetical protein
MSKDAIQFELDEVYKKEILEEFKNTPDIMAITRKVFNDETLDGRSYQGRAVKKFLAENGLKHKTCVDVLPKTKQKELTDEQKAFLMSDNLENGISALDAAKLCFKDKSIQSLSVEHRVVLDFLKEFRSDITDEQPITEKWVAPKALSRAIKKVNDWAGTNFDETTMPTKQKRGCEKLLIYLQSVRFRETINQFSTYSDRELFESEFVRAAWDKPDLTVDEQNLYINMCSNYVRLKHIQKRLDKLNNLLNDTEGQQDLSMRLTELIKATSDELNQCEKRIEALAKDLNGSRQNRLKEKGEGGGSILALVEAFQEREERGRMVLMADLQNKLIEEEADRLESMEELKARILGISKHELL